MQYPTKPQLKFKEKQAKVVTMVDAFEAAKKTEYLKPTTIAGFIFSRLVGDFLQGVQTPVSALVTTHYQSGFPAQIKSHTDRGPSHHKVYTHSFERVGNYLRTINDTIESTGIEVVVLQQAEGFYASFYTFK